MSEIDKLIEEITVYEASIKSLQNTIRDYSVVKNKLKEQLKKICTHPDDKIKDHRQGRYDDYGSSDGCDQWFSCSQCESESSREDWSYDRGQYILGSRRYRANKFYKELTGRDIPSNLFRIL